jgi:threonine dehydrogenase-like Zn-dependent dehydrogenase
MASDQLATSWFGAVAAEATTAKAVAAVRDGIVGGLAGLVAKRLGAERVITMSRHDFRQPYATEFGAPASSPV